MAQCWAQEPDQRPTFHKIQDQLQLFRKMSQCKEADSSGVINEGFVGKFDSLSNFSVFSPLWTEQVTMVMLLGWGCTLLYPRPCAPKLPPDRAVVRELPARSPHLVIQL